LPARSWVEISRAAIAGNYRAVRDLVGPGVAVAAVVKADGYRHGAVEVARILETEGTAWLAVSNASEGAALRAAGVTTRILVMADVPEVHEAGLTPVVHSLEAIARVRGPYHLKIDTGMGRLGTRAVAGEIARAVCANPQARLEGLMTHFASAADYIGGQTAAQIAHFDAIIEGLRGAGIQPGFRHAASTIPIAYGRRNAWYNMVRPGMAIYGYVSKARGDAPACELNVAPALTWRAALLDVKELPKGAPVGYGGQFVTPRRMRIGILAVGYADGLPHSLSNHGQVIAAGQWAAILGAVSMDVTAIDLSAAPSLRPGDAVTIIGREGEIAQDAQSLARAAGTISYSVLCGIHARVERRYL
jgi:alanine racemase